MPWDAIIGALIGVAVALAWIALLSWDTRRLFKNHGIRYGRWYPFGD